MSGMYEPSVGHFGDIFMCLYLIFIKNNMNADNIIQIKMLLFSLQGLVSLNHQRKSPVCLFSHKKGSVFTAAFEIDTEDIENTSLHPAV